MYSNHTLHRTFVVSFAGYAERGLDNAISEANASPEHNYERGAKRNRLIRSQLLSKRRYSLFQQRIFCDVRPSMRISDIGIA